MPKISFEPSRAVLKEISKGTDVFYLITLEGKIVKNEFGGIGYEQDASYADDENIAEVSIVFYDLKTYLYTNTLYKHMRGCFYIKK